MAPPNVGSLVALETGTPITISATVLHVVDLGGGETNYCLELPSGRTTWVLASQLEGAIVEPPDVESVGTTSDEPAPAAPAKRAAAKRAAKAVKAPA